MKNFLYSLLPSSLLLFVPQTPGVEGQIIQLHGSGTTNPSKCYWRIMSQMMQEAKLPLHLTYRAVGSSTGIFEFVGANNTTPFSYKAYNDFGSGDIPIPSDTYNELKAKNIEVAHFPFVLGAISFFHSVPGMEDGSNGLNLTSCQLARIFKRDIIYWDDDEIKESNPNMRLPFSNYPINVAHRVKGSSSTASITDYLYQSCEAEWAEDRVGSTIDWPEDTMGCEGSGGMTACIRDNEGTIGYIDSGHGHSENLVEIELKNADGTFLTSKQAGDSGIGLAALKALDDGILPSDSTHDYGHVKLLNMPGQNTWPIVAMTYAYLRVDLASTVTDPASQSLLKHFVASLYDSAVIGQCAEYGFTPVPTRVKDIAMEGLDKIQIDASAPEWSVETNTVKGGGQGDYVLSGKRRSYMELLTTEFTGDIGSISSTLNEMSFPSMNGWGGTDEQFTKEDKDQLRTIFILVTIALIGGWFSTVCWIVTFTSLIVKKLCC